MTHPIDVKPTPRSAPERYISEAVASYLDPVYVGWLLAFNDALKPILDQQRTLSQSKNDVVRPRAMQLMQMLVPLHRHLTKVLHQRNAIKTLEYTLSELAKWVVLQVLLPPNPAFVSDVWALPLPAELVVHILRHRGPHPWLHARVPQDSETEACLHAIAGTTLIELCTSYGDNLVRRRQAVRGHLERVLETVQTTLNAEDYALLRKHVRMPA